MTVSPGYNQRKARPHGYRGFEKFFPRIRTQRDFAGKKMMAGQSRAVVEYRYGKIQLESQRSDRLGNVPCPGNPQSAGGLTIS